ncbi:GNAT family N-acetyltransferase [Cellulomonas sp.]|uniref:GNAT family N-acetyltransferase n=1 Tax=Cellulomonas sp. TaxID=40001 RepID=UPI001B2ED327|nr:GNAT family N-acetyltransferase [Cellulomonas sp.]MBO9555854.1 GNAT family N-acetyltransferase [Cellulomonas sp.]
MSAPELVAFALDEWADVDAFTCGNPTLDAWLQDSAKRMQKAGTVRVTLVRRADDSALVGYYAICPTEVRRDEYVLSSRVRAAVSVVPGFMLAKLAVASAAQGAGLGRDLLVDALGTICDAAEMAGGRIVVVDPIDERAAGFYSKYGFTTIGGSGRMYMLIQDARRSLGPG